MSEKLSNSGQKSSPGPPITERMMRSDDRAIDARGTGLGSAQRGEGNQLGRIGLVVLGIALVVTASCGPTGATRTTSEAAQSPVPKRITMAFARELDLAHHLGQGRAFLKPLVNPGLSVVDERDARRPALAGRTHPGKRPGRELRLRTRCRSTGDRPTGPFGFRWDGTISWSGTSNTQRVNT